MWRGGSGIGAGHDQCLFVCVWHCYRSGESEVVGNGVDQFMRIERIIESVGTGRVVTWQHCRALERLTAYIRTLVCLSPLAGKGLLRETYNS